jgi:hypothetical protein
MNRVKAAAALVCALSLNPAVCSARIVDGSLAVLPAEPGFGPAIYIWGFEFSIAAPIQATGLAYYKDWAGPDDTHLVRLWDADSKTELARLSVGPGSTVVGAPDAFWASALPAPLVLGPGTYAVSGSPSPVDGLLQSLHPVSAPGITFVGAIYENPGVDSYPSGRTGGVAGPVYFGANLLFSPVPEPASAAMLFAGLLAAAAFGLRRHATGCSARFTAPLAGASRRRPAGCGARALPGRRTGRS